MSGGYNWKSIGLCSKFNSFSKPFDVNSCIKCKFDVVISTKTRFTDDILILPATTSAIALHDVAPESPVVLVLFYYKTSYNIKISLVTYYYFQSL